MVFFHSYVTNYQRLFINIPDQKKHKLHVLFQNATETPAKEVPMSLGLPTKIDTNEIGQNLCSGLHVDPHPYQSLYIKYIQIHLVHQQPLKSCFKNIKK